MQKFSESVSLMAFFFDCRAFWVFVGRFICFCMRKSLKNTFYWVLYIEVVIFFAVNFGFVIVYAFLGIKNHYGSSRVVVALLKFLLCYCLFCVKAVQR